MPFNRVNTHRVALDWLKVFRGSHVGETEEGNEEINAKDSEGVPLHLKYVPKYIPGLLLIPHPEDGPILGYLDISFLACAVYIIGSIIYLVDSVFLWKRVSNRWDENDDGLTPGNYLNLAASCLFVCNAMLCFLDGYLQGRQRSSMNWEYCNNDHDIHVVPISSKELFINFMNNIFFLFASLLYVLLGLWWLDPNTDTGDCYSSTCGLLYLNILAAMCYLISSLFCVWNTLEMWRQRKSQGLPPLKMFSWDWKSIDWFAYGDFLYVFASLEPLYQTLIENYRPDLAEDATNDILPGNYFVCSFLFLIDSFCYLLGYMVYIYDLQSSLHTGMHSIVMNVCVCFSYIGCDVYSTLYLLTSIPPSLPTYLSPSLPSSKLYPPTLTNAFLSSHDHTHTLH